MTGRPADFAVVNAAQLIIVGEGKNGPKRGSEQGKLDFVPNGALAAVDGRIAGVGTTEEIRARFDLTSSTVIDATGRIVMPGLVDSHTHPLFAGSRDGEFSEILGGLDREQVQQRGGGIWWTVLRTRAASTRELKDTLTTYFRNILNSGTTAIEAKSGYGQTPAEELRELEIIRDVSQQTPLRVVPTFLGAHILPKEHATGDSYAKEIIDVMLPEVAKQGIAKFVDTSCGQSFTPEIATRIIRQATDLGFANRVHAGGEGDGWKVAVDNQAASADHLTSTTAAFVEKVGPADTTATVIPASEVYYLLKLRAPVRTFIDTGVAVSIATDFCSSLNVPSLFSLVSFSAPWYRITPEETINAVTINPAYSIGLGKEIGSLTVGKRADLIVVDVPTYRQLIFEAAGLPRVVSVVVGGVLVGPNYPDDRVQQPERRNGTAGVQFDTARR